MDLAETDPETVFLLWAARETGALDALLGDADTAAEVAQQADLGERGADLLVASLSARGFLERVGEAHEPTNRLLGFLAAADLRSVGVLPDALDAIDALSALPETLATGEPPDVGDLHRRLGARAALDEATARAVTTAAAREAPGAERVLDVRGAPGHYARPLAELGYDVTLADRPAAVDRSRPLLAGTDVTPVAVEADDPLPGDPDLVFAGDVLRRLAPAAAESFVARLATAAAPAGTVVVADLLWGRSEQAVPAAVTAFARDGGTVHDADAVAAWFETAGLGTPTVESVPGTDRQVIVGHSDG